VCTIELLERLVGSPPMRYSGGSMAWRARSLALPTVLFVGLLMSTAPPVLGAGGRGLLQNDVASCRGGGFEKISCVGRVLAKKIRTLDQVLDILCEAEELRVVRPREFTHPTHPGATIYQSLPRAGPSAYPLSCNEWICLS
jgi:hypothetical protein